MTIELVPGTTNVVRLPSAGRTASTLDLLREITPDVREVSLIAAAYGVAMRSDDLWQRVDAETAEHISIRLIHSQVPHEPRRCGNCSGRCWWWQ